jgi:hypothetical protein
MFPSEERHKIEEEEPKRATEEKYRVELRDRQSSPTLTVIKKEVRLLRIVLAVVLAATILAVLVVNALMSKR